MKDCSGDLSWLKAVKSKWPHKDLYGGIDSSLIGDTAAAIDGIISVVTNAFPEEVVAFFKNPSQNRSYYEKILPLIKAMDQEVNPQGIKACLELMGFSGMDLRLPLVKVEDKTREQIAKELRSIEKQLAAF
jgi:4-hydroxy-tetrahydrodipicolinate synthase